MTTPRRIRLEMQKNVKSCQQCTSTSAQNQLESVRRKSRDKLVKRLQQTKLYATGYIENCSLHQRSTLDDFSVASPSFIPTLNSALVLRLGFFSRSLSCGSLSVFVTFLGIQRMVEKSTLLLQKAVRHALALAR